MSWRDVFRQSEDSCKWAWVVWGTRAGVGGHSSASDSQPDSDGEMPGGLPTDPRVPHPQNIEKLNFFLDEEGVKIMTFDLNQLQNEIWLNFFFVFFWLTRRMLKSRTLTWISRKMKFDELNFLLNFPTSIQFWNKQKICLNFFFFTV